MFSETEKQHHKDLTQAFGSLQGNDLKISLDKC